MWACSLLFPPARETKNHSLFTFCSHGYFNAGNFFDDNENKPFSWIKLMSAWK